LKKGVEEGGQLNRLVLMGVLAALLTLAALVPAFAQNITEIGGFRFKPGDCGNREGRDFTQAEARQFLENRNLNPDRLPDAENVCLLNPPGGDGGGDGRGAGGGGGGGGEGLSQSSEQEGESADINQDFSVTGEGDNSNQCVGIQGVGNTGNAQNQIDVIQYGSEAGDFEFEEVGSTIDVSPTNSTECTGEVNQAATATG
jgi:hypothetical protein